MNVFRSLKEARGPKETHTGTRRTLEVDGSIQINRTDTNTGTGIGSIVV